jgi:uncharacterized protein (TIGR02145 family)
MGENLRTTRYNDGTQVPLVTDLEVWSSLTSPGYSWHNNDATAMKNTYGALYNGYAVMTGKLCPSGWHVPSNAEWDELTRYLEGQGVVGGQVLLWGELKSVRTDPEAQPRWDKPNTGATDKSGFSALPGGMRTYMGSFEYLGKFGFFWSSTGSAFMGLRYDNAHIFRAWGNSKDGYSVRCLKD